MAKKHLKDEPHEIPNTKLWWYEENAGMKLYIPGGFHVGGNSQTPQIVIKWTDIRKALQRKDRPA